MQLTLYMLKDGIDPAGSGLRGKAAEYHEVRVRLFLEAEVRLLVKESDPTPPRWATDLLTIADNPDDLAVLSNRHGAALMAIRFRGYRFILVWGTARHVIDPSAIEPGFGLRVVANAVAASRIISADTRGLAGRTRSQRTVLPTAGPLYELGIEPTEEWVKQLEGKPTVDFASAAAGADSLKLQIRGFSLSKLEEKLAQIVEKFESNEYKAAYEFLDYFQRVDRNDKMTRERLEAAVRGLLKARSADVAFAAPDILEPQAADHYFLKAGRYRSPEIGDLTPDAVYGVLDSWPRVDPLHDVKILAVDSAGDLVGEPHDLADYIVAEVRLDDRCYTLSAGVWFVIDPTYVEGLQRRIAAIDDVTSVLALPTWDAATTPDEGSYNLALAARGWRVLDRDNFPIEKPNQKVEVCDLLTRTKQLVCVKKMTRSSTLSHLFAQGLVSAQLLVSNADSYQERVLDELQQIQPAACFGSRDEWTIVYAIATDKPGPLSDSLYFFSKVNLDRTVRQLNAIGIKVALARIPLRLAARKPKAAKPPRKSNRVPVPARPTV